MWTVLEQIIIRKAVVYLDRQLPARKGQSSYIYWGFFKHQQTHIIGHDLCFQSTTVQVSFDSTVKINAQKGWQRQTDKEK